MTCIVGIVHEGVTYIGGDSLGSDGYSKVIRKDKKVFKMKDTSKGIMGYTSSFRMGQLLMYAGGLIDSRDEPNINHEYLVTKFIPNVIRLFENCGYGKNTAGEKSGGEFLLGYGGSLYKIQEDYQVGESQFKYDACGCGEHFAMGSLYSTEGSSLTPTERIHIALKSAAEFSTGVSAPFYIVNTENNEIIELK